MKYRISACLLLVACLFCFICGCIKEKEELEKPIFKKLCWASGTPLPTAEDFVISLPEGATVRFQTTYRFAALGNYDLILLVTYPGGEETEHRVHLTMIEDTEPPVITGAKDLSAYIGEGIAYKNGVQISDNCDGELTLSVDSSNVKPNEEGRYSVVYTATDASGNTSHVEVTLYLYKEAITVDMLYELIDPLIASHISTDQSLEKQARDVYSYVKGKIAYDAYSDKNDWIRAAYEGLKNGKGDCFTYFAISKAFFERMGIQNMDVQRTPGIVDERHYWNYINIGSAENPLWYHFDACRLRGMTDSTCLLTDRQVQAYTNQRVDENGIGNYFYAYDSSAYPPSADKIITETPSLEPYE